jgi:CO/xanthine dehydrogenase FAD-binding subunit
MAIAHPFEYHKPATLDDALALQARYQGKVEMLAGGTDLINWLKEDFVQPAAVIDLKGIDALRTLEFKGNTLHVGALTTFRELIDAEIVKTRFPLIVEQSGVVGCHGVRNRATMVGNICSAVPCCDSGPVLYVYDAQVVLKSAKGERKVPIQSWFVAPKKSCRQPDEIVTGLEIPLPAGKNAGCYVKLGRYKGEDLAQASVAVLALDGGEYRVAFGAVGPTPIRATKIESILRGKELTASVLEQVIGLVPETIAPISDVRATKEYRLHMAKVMVKRGLVAAAGRLDGRGPSYGLSVI